jgi:hypothetical protein
MSRTGQRSPSFPSRHDVVARKLCVIVSLCAASGCTLLLPTAQTQCGSSDECADKGAGSSLVCVDGLCVASDAELPDGTDWSCLGSVPEPGSEQVTFDALVTDFISRSPIVEVEARLCNRFDVQCDAPIDGAITPLGNGVLRVTAAANFPGFIELSSPGRLPTLAMLDPYRNHDATSLRGMAIPMPSQDTLDTLAGLLRTNADGNRALLLAIAFDCSAQPAAAIQLDITSQDPDSLVFRLGRNGFPSRATETDPSGLLGVLNLPVGIGEVTAARASDDRVISTIGILTRAGAATVINLSPAQ